MRRSRGFTISELLMSMLLLSMGMAVAFWIMDFGVYGFRVGMMRQGLQAEGRRTIGLLERDIRQSCLDGISTDLYNQLSPQEPRHAISLPGLTDWTFPGNFDENYGDPKYDCYVLYYVTRTTPGRLYRVEVVTTAGKVRPTDPWKQFPSSFAVPPWSIGVPTVADIPGASPPLSVRKMADQVSGFRVQVPGNGCVVCQLTLRGQARTPGQKARDEIIQLNLYCPVYSVNTNPNSL